jgi:hypothetical protein
MDGYRRGFVAAAIIGLAGAISSLTVRGRGTSETGSVRSTVAQGGRIEGDDGKAE